jgi:hypothetical protein
MQTVTMLIGLTLGIAYCDPYAPRPTPPPGTERAAHTQATAGLAEPRSTLLCRDCDRPAAVRS